MYAFLKKEKRKEKRNKKKKEVQTLYFYLLFLSFIILETFAFEVMKNSQKEKSPMLKKASLYGRQEGRRFEEKGFLSVQSLARYIILKLCKSIAFLGTLKLFLRRQKN